MIRHGYHFPDEFADQENNLFAALQLSQPNPTTGEMNLASAREHIEQAAQYLDALRDALGPDMYEAKYGWVSGVRQRAA